MTDERTSVYFAAPYQAEVRREAMPQPGPGEVLVQTIISAISPGTEMLFYRGQVPPNLNADATISALAEAISYPIKYGYACVGRVIAIGLDVDKNWMGALVFAFNPHESHFVAAPENLIAVPDGFHAEAAALLPNMETAVNFLMDGQPIIGERVAVIGQGIVGLLTMALLAQFPLDERIAIDGFARRRECSRRLGAKDAFDPMSTPHALRDFDLIYELSGNPAALDQAINMAGFGGRIVVGSWYGQKRAAIDLGGHFHRNRIRLISSQVSTIAPAWTGRWDKARRLETAWRMLRQIDVAPLITQRFPVGDAVRAYALIDQQPEETIQVLLTYEP